MRADRVRLVEPARLRPAVEEPRGGDELRQVEEGRPARALAHHLDAAGHGQAGEEAEGGGVRVEAALGLHPVEVLGVDRVGHVQRTVVLSASSWRRG